MIWTPDPRATAIESARGTVWIAREIKGGPVMGRGRFDSVSRSWRVEALGADGVVLATWFSGRGPGAKSQAGKDVIAVSKLGRAIALLGDSETYRASGPCAKPQGPGFRSPCERCRPCLARSESSKRFRRAR